jgi:outer membrane protein with beta-barrel domain
MTSGRGAIASQRYRNYDGSITHAFASKWFGGCILPSITIIKERLLQNDHYRRFLLRKLAFLTTVFAFLILATLILPNPAAAQQGDAMFGFGTVFSPGANPCGFNATTGNINCPEKGGLYINLGADVIFHKRLGFGFDTAWRGGQGDFAGTGEPYRPILFDFNGVYQPRLGKKTGLDLMGGVGWQTTRFYGYQPTSSCVYFGACYSSSNHFLIDAGAGIRYYVWGHVFVRPEVRYYYVLNNTDVFTSGNVFRVGASIGYTIGGGPD